MEDALVLRVDLGDLSGEEVARVYEQYEKLLARNNALDFDDLLLRMAFLLRDRPEIREHLGRRYRYVLIDEYQDTNRAQYILAHGIALDHGNLCVTGDPDQSIYAWRGADISNILEFEHDYPEALVVRLEQNYRSTTPILAVASRLIDHNVSRRSKTLWTDRPGGEDVRVILCDDEKAEARLIVEDVGQLLDEGEDLDGVAVFYRVNALSRVIEEALVKGGLPYRIARGTEFYGRKVIKDVLAYLRLLHNPADDLSCARIVNTPTRGIGEKTVAALRALAAGRGCSLSEAAAEAHQARLGKAAVGKVKAFAKMIAELRADAESGVAAVVENVVARSGLGSALDADDEDARQDRANVNELVSAAQQFDEDNGGTLADYLQQVSLVSDADHFEGSGRGAVTLMTLHAAKGLEFPRVYMVGCEEGLLPFVRQGDSPGGRASDRDLEEERRLAFVGITRTMDELTLSAARYRTLRGRRTPQTPSPFLREMGTENVEVDDRTTPVSERLMQRRRRRGAAGGFYDDADERAVIEAMQDAHDAQTSDSGRGLGGASAGADGDTADPPPPEYEHLRVGCRVHHPTFGWGQVLRVGSQAWPETRAEIHFDQVGIKKIVLGRGPSLELME